MGWETFQSRDGIYAVDWQGVSRIIRSFARSKAMVSKANTKVNEEFHWIGPTLHTVDVNWDQVRRQTDNEGEMLLSNFYQMLRYNPQAEIARLVHWADQTRLNNAKFHQMMRDAQKQTMENIDKSVDRAEIGLKIARHTRDFSAEFLMVSATIVSGGTAAALAAAGGITVGAGLKATARGQDDPSATKKQIAATFATEFAVGVLDLGAGKMIKGAAGKAAEAAVERAVGGTVARKVTEKAAEKGTTLALAMLWNQVKGIAVEPGKAVIEGETFQKGLLTGALKTGGGIHGEILKYLVLDDQEFPKLAAIADTTISYAADEISKALTEKKEEKEHGAEPELVNPETDEHALLDCLAYERRMVEQMALQKIGSFRPPAPSHSGLRPATSFRR